MRRWGRRPPGALPADDKCCASICSIVALVGAAAAGLFLKKLGGQVVFYWCLALAIISTPMLLTFVCICRCAYAYSSSNKATKQDQFMKKTALPKVLRSA